MYQWNRIKYYSSCLLLGLVLTLPLVWADTQSDDLSSLEKQVFSHSFAQDSIEARISRLEQTTFGQVQQGDTENRIQKLQQVFLENKPADQHIFTQANSPESQYGTPNKSQDATDYPAVTKLEDHVFGQTYTDQDVTERLTRLEHKLYGKTFDELPLVDRVDQLSLKVFPNGDLGVEEGIAKNTLPGSGSELSPNSLEIYSQLTTLEEHVFGQAYGGELLTNRLARLENKAFGATKRGNVDNRMDRLMAWFQRENVKQLKQAQQIAKQMPYQPKATMAGVLGSQGFSQDTLSMLPPNVRSQMNATAPKTPLNQVATEPDFNTDNFPTTPEAPLAPYPFSPPPPVVSTPKPVVVPQASIPRPTPNPAQFAPDSTLASDSLLAIKSNQALITSQPNPVKLVLNLPKPAPNPALFAPNPKLASDSLIAIKADKAPISTTPKPTKLVLNIPKPPPNPSQFAPNAKLASDSLLLVKADKTLLSSKPKPTKLVLNKPIPVAVAPKPAPNPALFGPNAKLSSDSLLAVKADKTLLSSKPKPTKLVLNKPIPVAVAPKPAPNPALFAPNPKLASDSLLAVKADKKQISETPQPIQLVQNLPKPTTASAPPAILPPLADQTSTESDNTSLPLPPLPSASDTPQQQPAAQVATNNFLPAFASTDPKDFNRSLANLENQVFGRSFPNANPQERLTNLEMQAFGRTNSNSQPQARLNKLIKHYSFSQG